MSEALRTAAIGFGALLLGVAWQSIRTALVPTSSPERLVSELRLAQLAALLLVMSAGAYIGFAVASESRAGVGIDIALTLGFFIVAAATLVRDPRHALTILALAFAAHAVLDVAHRPGWLPDGIAPRWYAVGCAVYDLLIGALCYFPILKR